MAKKIKIAIPTDDEATISPYFGGSRGFIVLTINDSGIIRTEMRWNRFSDILTSKHGNYYNIYDCQAVLVNVIGSCHCQRLDNAKKEVIRTDEILITKAVFGYLESFSCI